MICTSGFFDFRYSPTPVMVPPVPMPEMKASTCKLMALCMAWQVVDLDAVRSSYPQKHPLHEQHRTRATRRPAWQGLAQARPHLPRRQVKLNSAHLATGTTKAPAARPG